MVNRLSLLLSLAVALLFAPAAVFATDYFISNSGNDGRAGTSAGQSWQTFTRIPRPLSPGDRLFLERGSIWYNELTLSGQGTPTAVIEVTAYGDVSKSLPRLNRANQPRDICMVVENPSHWVIHNIDMRHAWIGVFLKYMNVPQPCRNVTIEYCTFSDIDLRTPFKDIDELEGSLRSTNYQYSYPAAIMVGGSANPWQTVVSGVTVRNCIFDWCNIGVNVGFWHHTKDFRAFVTDLLIRDCRATSASNGGFSLMYVTRATIDRFSVFNDGGNRAAGHGVTGAFLASCANVTMDGVQIRNVKRPDGVNAAGVTFRSPDGVGIDFEGNTSDVVLRNSLFHDNEGPAILVCTTWAPNDNLRIENNVMANNCKNYYKPTQNDTAHGFAFMSWHNANTGVVSGNTIVKGAAVDYFAPTSNGFVKYGNTLLTTGSHLLLGEAALRDPRVFNADEYLALNGDLNATTLVGVPGATLYEKAFYHWKTWGVNEGRHASHAFKIPEYRANYGDLGSLSNLQLVEHFVNWGYYEGRKGTFAANTSWLLEDSRVFDAEAYMAMNGDLNATSLAGYPGRTLQEKAANHWKQFGVDEGRASSARFKVTEYRAMYGDLAALTNRQLVDHYIRWGIAEGRRGCY